MIYIGFSLTGAHVIFFVSSVIVAGAVSGVFIAVTTGLMGSFSDRGIQIQEKIETDFAIINDPTTIPSVNNSYVFYLKNIGLRSLVCSNTTIQVFIDGDIISSDLYHFDTEIVLVGDIVSLYIHETMIDDGFHTVRIVGPSTVQDIFEFVI